MIGAEEKLISRLRDGNLSKVQDLITVEEPLELVLWAFNGKIRTPVPLSVTMRTPGEEEYWTIGFLITEGVIESAEEIEKIDLEFGIHEKWPERVHVYLNAETSFNSDNLTRHFYANSSCGVCGKASIDQVKQNVPFFLDIAKPKLTWEFLKELPIQLDRDQFLFNKTGSIHATALFDTQGNLIKVCEDVGRHNAMDKLIGFAVKNLQLPLSAYVVLVSGRASFELIQKALMGGIPVVLAIGAPSSLAIDLAQSHQQTLVGFLSKTGMNIYSDPGRITIQG